MRGPLVVKPTLSIPTFPNWSFFRGPFCPSPIAIAWLRLPKADLLTFWFLHVGLCLAEVPKTFFEVPTGEPRKARFIFWSLLICVGPFWSVLVPFGPLWSIFWVQTSATATEWPKAEAWSCIWAMWICASGAWRRASPRPTRPEISGTSAPHSDRWIEGFPGWGGGVWGVVRGRGWGGAVRGALNPRKERFGCGNKRVRGRL